MDRKPPKNDIFNLAQFIHLETFFSTENRSAVSLPDRHLHSIDGWFDAEFDFDVNLHLIKEKRGDGAN
jgi:hypothetical protein